PLMPLISTKDSIRPSMRDSIPARPVPRKSTRIMDPTYRLCILRPTDRIPCVRFPRRPCFPPARSICATSAQRSNSFAARGKLDFVMLKRNGSGEVAKFLLVEDDVVLAKKLVEWFSAENHTVEIAYTGEDALQLLANFKYDVVLLDWNLTDISGLSVCKQFRS